EFVACCAPSIGTWLACTRRMPTKTDHDPSMGFELPTKRRLPSGRAPASAPGKTLPEDVLAIIPVRQLVLFPGSIAPISLVRAGSIAAANDAIQHERPLGLLLQRDPETDAPGAADLHHTGTVASVLRHITAEDGANYLVCQGERRFRVLE